MVVLIGVLVAAVIADIRRYKIPNLCIVTGIIAGTVMTIMSYSSGGVIMSVIQMLIIFVLFYPFYLIRALGAGDVKLFMMMGCWFQGERLLSCLLVIMLIAGVISAMKMLLFKESRERLYYLGRYIRKAIYVRAIDEYEVNTLQGKNVIRLSVPALIGLILMYLGVY